ncbi:hypothetical protein ABZW11_31965 [Nonomuraea sp. NPDC004580]|uniref:hypothetical protein n=1 Tax=Nonomuraea sp. NPDC004580 TaxID=3154552 RepID=UPI0033AC3CD3
MASSRVRVLIMVGVLGLLAAAGVVWLVGVATGGPGGSPAGAGVSMPVDDEVGPDEVGPDEDVPDEVVPDEAGPGEVQSPVGEPTSQEKSQGNNRRSVRWNGVRLDGSTGDDGCVTIINKTSTVATIESVSFEVRSGPGRATARSAPGHCEPTGDPLCQGVTLRAGSQCLAGAVITGEPSDSPYVIQAVVHFRYRCVNVEDAPCDEVQDWAGPPPTEQRPVEIRGATANNVPQFDYYIGDDTDTTASPEPSPEITETPDPTGVATPSETAGFHGDI